jgi:hypothetical protein
MTEGDWVTLAPKSGADTFDVHPAIRAKLMSNIAPRPCLRTSTAKASVTLSPFPRALGLRDFNIREVFMQNSPTRATV